MMLGASQLPDVLPNCTRVCVINLPPVLSKCIIVISLQALDAKESLQTSLTGIHIIRQNVVKCEPCLVAAVAEQL